MAQAEVVPGQSLPPLLRIVPTLRRLYMDLVDMSSYPAAEVMAVDFANLPQLEVLSMHNTGLATLPEDVAVLASNSTLRELHVGMNGLSVVGDNILKHQRLELLDLSGNRLNTTSLWMDLPNGRCVLLGPQSGVGTVPNVTIGATMGRLEVLDVRGVSFTGRVPPSAKASLRVVCVRPQDLGACVAALNISVCTTSDVCLDTSPCRGPRVRTRFSLSVPLSVASCGDCSARCFKDSVLGNAPFTKFAM